MSGLVVYKSSKKKKKQGLREMFCRNVTFMLAKSTMGFSLYVYQKHRNSNIHKTLILLIAILETQTVIAMVVVNLIRKKK